MSECVIIFFGIAPSPPPPLAHSPFLPGSGLNLECGSLLEFVSKMMINYEYQYQWCISGVWRCYLRLHKILVKFPAFVCVCALHLCICVWCPNHLHTHTDTHIPRLSKETIYLFMLVISYHLFAFLSFVMCTLYRFNNPFSFPLSIWTHALMFACKLHARQSCDGGSRNRPF